MSDRGKDEEFLSCDSCGVTSVEDDSVQERECGHALCENCIPCQICLEDC